MAWYNQCTSLDFVGLKVLVSEHTRKMIFSARDMVVDTAERTVVLFARVEWANLLLCLTQNLLGANGTYCR